MNYLTRKKVVLILTSIKRFLFSTKRSWTSLKIIFKANVVLIHKKRQCVKKRKRDRFTKRVIEKKTTLPLLTKLELCLPWTVNINMKLKLAVTNSCNQVLKTAHNMKTSRSDISRSTYTLDLALWNLWKISSIKKNYS